MDSFAPYSTNPLCFIVQNITSGNKSKTIRIFNAPINSQGTRDLMALEGVAESDIRASLLKGELRNRLINQEITVLCSNIDLLQFSAQNLAFLTAAGITNGTTVQGGGSTNYLIKQGLSLIGTQDGTNRTFTTPDIFINQNFEGNLMTIDIFHNGRRLALDYDFELSESGGTGTGFDTVDFSFSPAINSIILVNYYVEIL